MKRWGIILIVVGAAIFALSVGEAGHPFRSLIERPAMYPSPGRFEQNLGRGTWEVFAATGSVDDPIFPTMDASDVTVTGADGSSVAVDPAGFAETRTFGNSSFVLFATFHIAQSGLYTITSDGPQGSSVALERPLTTEMASALPSIGGFVAGSGALAAGLIVLIYWAAHRSRPATPPGGSPPSGPPGRYPAAGYPAAGYPTSPPPWFPPGAYQPNPYPTNPYPTNPYPTNPYPDNPYWRPLLPPVGPAPGSVPGDPPPSEDSH